MKIGIFIWQCMINDIKGKKFMVFIPIFVNIIKDMNVGEWGMRCRALDQ